MEGHKRPIGWIRFDGYTGSAGTIEGTPRLRRLAHAILRATGDPAPAPSGQEDADK